jgi:hypothetical protein
LFVMAGLVPAIHDRRLTQILRGAAAAQLAKSVFMDHRDKPGDDGPK